MIFNQFLTLSALAFSTIGKDYRLACKVVENAISDASKVYYPGGRDYEQLSSR